MRSTWFHAVDQRQLRIRLGFLQQQRVAHADLDVIAPLNDQCRNVNCAKGSGRVLAEQRDQVRLDTSNSGGTLSSVLPALSSSSN